MSRITYDVSQEFPFHELSLANPNGVQGGAYFSKIRIKDDESFLFQTPKCLTKNGIVSTDKKIYCDLMFTNDNEKFINFIQELEKSIQHLIYEKRNLWFHNNMEMENIEYFFNPIIRTYKKHFVVRTYIQQPKHIKSTKSLQIYDENENRLTIKDVTKEKKIIAILEGLGIKFTSSSFHLELCLRQVMVIDNKPIFHKCLIQMGKNVPTHAEKERENNTKITMDVLPSGPKQLEKKQPLIEKDVSENIVSSPISAPLANTAEEKKEDIKEEQTMTDISNNIKVESDEETASICDSEPEGYIESENELSDNEKDDIENKTEPLSVEKLSSEDKTKPESLEQKNNLREINVDIPSEEETVSLKQPIVVYREIYKQALEKAKMARRLAIRAFLEAKQIKNTFLAGEVEESDDEFDSFEEFENM